MTRLAIEVIPVLDLKGTAVVRARHGLRQSYAPIVSKLAKTSAPLDVTHGLLAIHPFRTVYIADLDRIEQRGDQGEVIAGLIEIFPNITFWVDCGVRDSKEAHDWLTRHRKAHLVLGSESLRELGGLAELAATGRVILSLDFREDRFLGPQALRESTHLWPSRIIIMTLSRIGSDAGADMNLILTLKRQAPETAFFAAGGLRDASDLIRLAQAGISGVLVASALHDGRLTSADLAAADPVPVT